MSDNETSEKPALDIANLSHSFKSHKALNGVNFTVAQKSIHGFVGPNGAGKTTTLKAIATLLKPQRGTVKVFGLNVISHYKEVRRKIGFMPDHFSMYRQMTVFEYLDFFAAAYGLNIKERDQVINDVLTLTDMEGRKDDIIKGLSRGMQQRVSLARVLVHDPDLLLLDEPASGLDPRARIELMEILQELRNMGKTIFISSHILSELADLCDSVTILDRGQVKYTGNMKGLLKREQNSEGSQAYKLVLAEPSDSLVEQLQSTEGVDSVEAMEAKPSEYVIQFSKELCSTNKLLSIIASQEVEVLNFTEDVKHLNEAFMNLTEAGVREK
ncbi:MAG: ABC transporter ATP-binding protein [Lentisphaeraceae bacterium]|nr:ABC transporter ATP-binding protein [Lentisphaeraceae bacterium]